VSMDGREGLWGSVDEECVFRSRFRRVTESQVCFLFCNCFVVHYVEYFDERERSMRSRREGGREKSSTPAL
jgi:hypothetical protein